MINGFDNVTAGAIPVFGTLTLVVVAPAPAATATVHATGPPVKLATSLLLLSYWIQWPFEVIPVRLTLTLPGVALTPNRAFPSNVIFGTV